MGTLRKLLVTVVACMTLAVSASPQSERSIESEKHYAPVIAKAGPMTVIDLSLDPQNTNGYTHSIRTWNDNNEHRTDCTYSSSGDLILSVIRNWSNETNDWTNSEMTEYVYNDQGLMTEEAHSKWNTAVNDWEKDKKWAYEYNYNGVCSKRICFTWIANWQDWACTFCQEYNGSGEITLFESYYYSEVTNKMVGNSRETHSYANVDGGILTTSILYEWSVDGDNWEPREKVEAFSNQNEWSDKEYEYVGSTWNLTVTNTLKYDSNGNLTSYERFGYENDVKVGGQREVWAYDDKGREYSYRFWVYGDNEYILWKYIDTEYIDTEYIDSEYLLGSFKSESYEFLVYGEGFSLMSKSTGDLDEEGRIVSRNNYKNINAYKNEPEEFELTDRQEYVFSPDGHLIMEVEYKYKDGEIDEGWKNEYSINDKDVLTSNTWYKWSKDDATWILHGKYEKFFSEDDKVIECRHSSWSNDREDWDIVSNTRYTFNTDGTVNQYIYYSTRHIINGNLEKGAFVTTYYYNNDSGFEDIIQGSNDFKVMGRCIGFSDGGYKEVYTINGVPIYRGHAQNIELPSAGMYLVCTSRSRVKIFVR